MDNRRRSPPPHCAPVEAIRLLDHDELDERQPQRSADADGSSHHSGPTSDSSTTCFCPATAFIGAVRSSQPTVASRAAAVAYGQCHESIVGAF